MAGNSEIKLKDATLYDIEEIQKVAREAWLDHYPSIISLSQIDYMLVKMYGHSQIASEIESGSAFWILAFQGSELLAFASWGTHINNPKIARLNKLYALPKCKGQGIGKQLLNEVEIRSKLAGFTEIELNVNRKNPTIAFYEKMGFSILTEDLIDIGGGFEMCDYLMRKSI